MRKLKVYEIAPLTEQCILILKKKLLKNLKDPRSFTNPSTIGNLKLKRVLYNLSSSINFIALFVFKKFDFGKVIPSNITLQIMTQSLSTSYGILDDALVKVENFIFLIDFVVLEIKVVNHVSIILGMPF